MYTEKHIDDYQKKITTEQTKELLKFCNRYNVEPNICAWYSDMEDFFDDWQSHGYTRTQARKLLHGGKGEFKIFKNGEIVRLVL